MGKKAKWFPIPYADAVWPRLRAYKLLRLRKDGTLGPLFVGRGLVIEPGREYVASSTLPHPGLAHRPGFHCCAEPKAPHIKRLLKTGERRVWCEVEIKHYQEHRRPQCQGGVWYTAANMRVLRVREDLP